MNRTGRLAVFRAKLRARGDRGVLNLLKNLLLEPRNPFEPEKRRLPKGFIRHQEYPWLSP